MTSSTIVIGAGIAGTSTALELSRRGRKVLLLEQFGPGHRRGSSHGPTRIFRLSYKDPEMVALAEEALDDWRRLERDARESLLTLTGGLDLGPGALECADALQGRGVEASWLEESECLERFGVRVQPGTSALFQKDAGVIAAGRSVTVQTELAVKAGARVFYDSPVVGIDASEDKVSVSTSDGRSFVADDLVVAAGPWTGRLSEAAGSPLPLVVTHEQVTYLAGVGPSVPVVIEWSDPARYLVPQYFEAAGARVGVHGAGEAVDPDDGPFSPDPARERLAAEWTQALTGNSAFVVGSESCLYTNAPEERFVISRTGRITIVSACSGHGFKFGPRIGRAVADIAQGIDPRLPGSLGQWWSPATEWRPSTL